MTEREPPDLDRVREALRDHDERRETEEAPPERPPEDDQPDDGEDEG